MKYRYRKAENLRVNDRVLLSDGAFMTIGRIEQDLADERHLIFSDEVGDRAIDLYRGDMIRVTTRIRPEEDEE